MFVNLSKDLLGIGPGDGTTYQVSSYGRRVKGLPGIVGEFQRKCVDLKAGETFTMADIEGPGLITRLWVTVPRRSNPGVLRNVVFRAFWDDEQEPSVLTPIGDLFGTSFSRPLDYSSAYLSITSGAYICFFPMPFQGRAVLTVQNQSRLAVRLYFYQVTYLKLDRDLAEGTPYFHCHWHREELDRDGPPFTVVDAEGRGFYLGCHVNMQGRGWPWRPNPLHTQLPEGFGMGMLEGWERIWIDGAGEPNVHGTGGEDYFNGAWYFTHVPSTTLTHGVTVRNYPTRRVSCYRFHVEMPVGFREKIRVALDHGLDNKLPAVYDGTAFWYQVEPHLPFAEMPGARERRVSGGAANTIIMAAPFAGAAAAASLAVGARKRRRAVVENGRTGRERGCSRPRHL